MAAWDFSPNFFAQALRSSRTNKFGMLTSDHTNKVVLPVLRDAENGFVGIAFCPARRYS